MPGNMPIRWDNIGGGGIAEAASPMANAATLFNNAFSGLKDVVQSKEANDQANWQNQKTNNTTQFLNNLYAKYTNADDLNSAIKNGDVAKQLAGYGMQIDADKVRGAAEGRLQTLQQQGIQNIAYQHTMSDAANEGTLDEYKVAMRNGDQLGAAAALQKLQANHARNIADAVLYGQQATQQTKTWDNENRLADDRHLESGVNMKVAQQNADSSRISANAAASNARTAANEFGLNTQKFGLMLQDHIQQQQQTARQELGSLYDLDPRSGNGAKMIADELDKTKDGNLSDNQKRVYQTMLQDPKATTGGIIAAIRGMNTVWYKPDFMSRGNAIDLGNQVSQSEGSLAQQKSVEARKGMVVDKLDKLGQQLTQAQSAYPITGGVGYVGGNGQPVQVGAAPGNTVKNPFMGMDGKPLSLSTDAPAAAQKTAAPPPAVIQQPAPGQKSVMFSPPAPVIQQAGDDPQVKMLQNKLASLNAKGAQGKMTADDVFAKRQAESDLRDALKTAGDRVLANARGNDLKRLDLNSIINQASLPR